MNKQSSWFLAGTIGVLAVCCLFVLIGWVVVALNILGAASPNDALAIVEVTPVQALAPTLTCTATSTRVPTGTPAPTYTRVIQLPADAATAPYLGVPSSPTAASSIHGGVYNVIVPTPTAPPMVHSIQFISDLRVTTYPVSGWTIEQLGQSLEAHALLDPHEPSGHYYARTDWGLAADWHWKETAKGCEVDRGSITLSMTMTLPALASRSGVQSNVLNRWDDFMDKTITHEKGHAKLSLTGARNYEQVLGNYPATFGCDDLKSQLKKLFDSSFKSIDQANIDYDTTTQHGMTQGAVFP